MARFDLGQAVFEKRSCDPRRQTLLPGPICIKRDPCISSSVSINRRRQGVSEEFRQKIRPTT